MGTNVSVARALREALALPWRTARGWSSVALGLELLAGLLPAAAAYCVKLLVDALSAPAVSPETVSAAVIASVACTALLSLTSLAASHVGSRLRSATGLAVDAELFRAVEARFERLDELETPAWQNKVRLAESAAQQVPGQVTELGYSALRTVVTLSALAAVVAQAAASLALLLFALAAVTTWAQLSRSGDDARSEAAFVQQWRWREFYRALLLEPRAAKEVRLFGLGEFLVGRLAGRTLKAQAARFAAERVRLLIQGGFVVAAATVTAVGAWWVATEAARHHLRPGDVTLFLAAAGGLHSALGGFVASVALGGRSLLLFRHYLELVEAAAQHRRAGRPSLAAGPLCEAIELRDVWFRYSDDGPWVLRGVDLTLRRGQALGLVGLNGAGKSTLVKVLCGLHRPQLGRVLWDGRDLAALSAASLRARIAAVFQDFMTYELTAAENIGLGRLAQLDDPVAI
ncbi:MAG: ABC transporter ATP-binding protein/permease [Archangiaceae bacterium]|nr:ABC transporter ATP-binding protein/permease [Archangiaceae bacterium]